MKLLLRISDFKFRITFPSSTFIYYLLSVAFCLFIFSSCENDIDEVNIITAKNNYPVESGKDMEVIYSDSGRIKIKLNAPVMMRYTGEKPYLEMPKGVKVLFYDDTMNVNSHLSANYAISREKEEIMEARNNVVVVNEKGEQLNTEHLVWDKKQATIHTKEFVKITTADEIIYGNGLESNQSFTKYKIKDIKGTINLKE